MKHTILLILICLTSLCTQAQCKKIDTVIHGRQVFLIKHIELEQATAPTKKYVTVWFNNQRLPLQNPDRIRYLGFSGNSDTLCVATQTGNIKDRYYFLRDVDEYLFLYKQINTPPKE